MTRGRATTRRDWLRRCGALGAVGMAGCTEETDAASEGDGSDGPNGTEADTDSGIDIGFPPGVSEDGLEDADALFEAHRSALMGTSFTGKSRSDDLVDGDKITALRVTVRADPDAGRVERIEHLRNSNRNGDPESEERLYIDGDRVVTDFDDPVDDDTTSGVIDSFLERLDLDAIESYDGTRTIDAGPVHAFDLGEMYASTEDDGTMLVDEDGLIRRYSTTHRLTTDDAENLLENELTVGEIGSTSVTEPAWVDDAATDADA